MAGVVRIVGSLRPLAAVLALFLSHIFAPAGAQSFYDECDAQYDNLAESVSIRNGESAVREIQANHTHRFEYTNFNLSTLALNDTDRKVIFSLEPCYGVVFLFVRKNIPCHPDPYSCINLETDERDARMCRRTHFVSKIDGSRDGSPTFFRISLTASRYFISVFATEDSRYTLTVLDDVGAWPMRGNNGEVQAQETSTPGTIALSWNVAEYAPVGVSETKQYHVFAVPLVENDTWNSTSQVFIRPGKILNTYCGLQNNTDRSDDIIDALLCDTACNTTLPDIINGRTYAFNVVAESHRGFFMAYGGRVLKANFVQTVGIGQTSEGSGRRLLEEVTPTPIDTARRLMEASKVPMDSRDMQVVGAVLGSVLGMVGVAGMILLRFAS